MKTTHCILILSMIIAGCGTKQGSNAAANNPSDQNSPQTSHKGFTSFYVADVSELKACTTELYGALAYIKATDSFKTCEDSGWVDVDIKGKDGTSGKDGQNGVDGKDGTKVDNTLWTDPITNKTWKALGFAPAGPLENWYAANGYFHPLCVNNYTEPKLADVQMAAAHGMFAAFNQLATAYSDVWEMDSGGYRRFNIQNAAYTNATEQVSTEAAPRLSYTAAIVCIKN